MVPASSRQSARSPETILSTTGCWLLSLAAPAATRGAAESKALLVEAGLGIPYVTLSGRRGGSALAAAAVNALAGPQDEGLA